MKVYGSLKPPKGDWSWSLPLSDYYPCIQTCISFLHKGKFINKCNHISLPPKTKQLSSIPLQQSTIQNVRHLKPGHFISDMLPWRNEDLRWIFRTYVQMQDGILYMIAVPGLGGRDRKFSVACWQDFIRELLGNERPSQRKWTSFLRITLKVILWPSHTGTHTCTLKTCANLTLSFVI